mgnify:CR=1 FL=1
MEKVVLRFMDGSTLKGYVENFTPFDDIVEIKKITGEKEVIPIDRLKAIFFVKTFEGDPEYSEKKAFSISGIRLKRVFVKFKDGEAMTGYIEGEIPWQKGFFLEEGKKNGFLLLPTDDKSNNIKVYVVAKAVKDVTLVG